MEDLDGKGRTWAHVKLGDSRHNKVWSDLVTSLHWDMNDEPEAPGAGLAFNHNRHLLSTIILHELSHVFAQRIYGNLIITPVGGEPGSKSGGRTWELEDRVLGGRLLVEWRSQGAFRLSEAQRPVFKGANGVTYDLSDEAINAAFCSSLKNDTLLAIPPPGVTLPILTTTVAVGLCQSRNTLALGQQGPGPRWAISATRIPGVVRNVVGADVHGARS